MDELPMDQGWAFYAWDIENDGWLAFNGVKRSEAGYIAQQVQTLLKSKRSAKSGQSGKPANGK